MTYRLLLKFKNREERIFDLSPYLNIGKFAELRDVNLFNTVAVKFDSIEWANHLDLDPGAKGRRRKIQAA